MVDAATRLTGILSYPVGHSFSPLIHNAAFRAQGLNMLYVGLSVPPPSLAAAVAGLKALGFVGANVTLPHKEAVIPHLDRLSAQAHAVGAVNTIVIDKGQLYGDNTDVAGFVRPLASWRPRLRGCEAVVLGAGGAARAAVYALLTRCLVRHVTIAARRIEAADRLCSVMDVHGSVAAVRLARAGDVLRRARLVVNATPVGMHPKANATPWEDGSVFGDQHLMYDLIYRPRTTQLMRMATRRGARVIGGLPMLLCQAAEAYLQWTGKEMPLPAARRAIEHIR